MNWRRWAWTGDPNAPDEYYQAADEAAGASVGERTVPALQTVGGVAEVTAGAGLVASGVGSVAGGVLIAHGVDTAVAGARGLYEGETKETVTKQVVTAATGSSTAGIVVDAAIPIVAGVSGGIAIARKQAAQRIAAKAAATEASGLSSPIDGLTKAEENLGRLAVPGKKTVATDPTGQRSLSGWTEKEGFVQKTDEVMEKAAEVGHELKPNKLLDQGVPGRYNGSHAEKQLAIVSEGPIAVSKPMCADCIAYFQSLAKSVGRPYTVTDPGTTRLFMTDGSVIVIPK